MRYSKMRVLVVDDEPSALAFAESIMKDEDFSVLTAESVREAIYLLEKYVKIHLILTDVEMPNEDGFVLIKFLSKNLRFSEIPVVLCTGHADASTVARALKAAARDYIVKPYNRETLISKIRSILESGKGTVLIASGDDLQAKIIAATVGRDGYKPIVVTHGREIEPILTERKIDVLITDRAFPGMSGLELMVKVKEEFQHVPVFFIENHATRLVEEEVIAQGADGVIRRPFSNREICAKISGCRRIKRNTAVKEIEIIRKVLKSAHVTSGSPSR